MLSEISFVDLAAQRNRLRDRIDQAIAAVLDHGAFIQGPEVRDLERRLASFAGVRHVITCGNGTDALVLSLMAHNIGAGDAVLVPAYTFAATAEAVCLTGATPIFADVQEDSFLLSPDDLPRALILARERNLRLRGVIPVDLFGRPANYQDFLPLCEQENLVCLADAAQAMGATYDNRPVGSLAHVTATSFFPSKPLGCYGDGGAIFTDDDELADRLRSLHQHGRGKDKYDNIRIGLNSRLDTIQAAILLAKLDIFPDEILARQQIAQYYTDHIPAPFRAPETPRSGTSVWAQYSIICPAGRRQDVRDLLKGRGIPTACYYPMPLHQQTAYRNQPRLADCLPVSERLSVSMFSLPMHPYLSRPQMDHILQALQDAGQFWS